MTNKLFSLLILLTLIFADNNYKTENTIVDMLERIISKYEDNFSLSLTVEQAKTKSSIDIDMMWVNNDEIIRKTRLRFLEPPEFEGMHVWIWSLKNNTEKKWATTLGSGKKKDISKNKLYDFPSILPDASMLMLEDFHIISDTLVLNNSNCIVIDVYKILKGKKTGPLTKLWIDVNKELLYKIQKIDSRKNIITKEINMQYFKDINSENSDLDKFPQIIYIEDFQNKNISSISLSNYKINQNFDATIFDPIDIK